MAKMAKKKQNNNKENEVLKLFFNSLKYYVYLTNDRSLTEKLINAVSREELSSILDNEAENPLIRNFFINQFSDQSQDFSVLATLLHDTLFNFIIESNSINNQIIIHSDYSALSDLEKLLRDFNNLRRYLSISSSSGNFLAENQIFYIVYIQSIVMYNLLQFEIDPRLVLLFTRGRDSLPSEVLRSVVSRLTPEQKTSLLEFPKYIEEPLEHSKAEIIGRVVNDDMEYINNLGELNDIIGKMNFIDMAISVAISLEKTNVVEVLINNFCRLLDFKLLSPKDAKDFYNNMIINAGNAFARGNAEICKLFVQSNFWQIIETQDQLRLLEVLFERAGEITRKIILQELFDNNLFTIKFYQELLKHLPNDFNAQEALEPFFKGLLSKFPQNLVDHIMNTDGLTWEEVENYVSKNRLSVKQAIDSSGNIDFLDPTHGETLNNLFRAYNTLCFLDELENDTKTKQKKLKTQKNQISKKETELKCNKIENSKELIKKENKKTDSELPTIDYNNNPHEWEKVCNKKINSNKKQSKTKSNTKLNPAKPKPIAKNIDVNSEPSIENHNQKFKLNSVKPKAMTKNTDVTSETIVNNYTNSQESHVKLKPVLENLPSISFGNFDDDHHIITNSSTKSISTEAEQELKNQIAELKSRCRELEYKIAHINTETHQVQTLSEHIELERYSLLTPTGQLVIGIIYQNIANGHTHHIFHHTNIQYVIQNSDESSNTKQNTENDNTSAQQKAVNIEQNNAALSAQESLQNNNIFKAQDVEVVNLAKSATTLPKSPINEEIQEYQNAVEEVKKRADENVVKPQFDEIKTHNCSNNELYDFYTGLFIPNKNIYIPFTSNIEPIFVGEVNLNGEIGW